MAGDQRLRRPVLPGRGELPSPICCECICREPWALRSLVGESSQLSLKAAGIIGPDFPRRGLNELVPCETVDRENIKFTLAFKGSI